MSYWENEGGPVFYADRVTPVPNATDRCPEPIPGGGHTCKLHVDHAGSHECPCGRESENVPVAL